MKRIISSSVITGVLALALITTATPTHTAQAATRAEMEATIASLLAQVQHLQALLQARQSAAVSINLTRNLTVGMTGSDVKALQQFLNSDPATAVALSGIGSKGNETTYFGPATQAAVIKFQNKYRNEVLTPAGLVNATGYVGPTTRTKINMLAQRTQVQTQTQTNTDTSNDDDTDTNTNPTVAEEGSTVVTRGSEHTSTLELTGDYDEIYSVQIKAEDSAMTINRIEFMFDKRPWRYIDTFVLYHNGDKVKEITASEKTISESGDEYRLRISNLDEVVEKGEKDTFVLEAKALDGLSGSREADTLTVYVPENGVRAVDTAKYTAQEPQTALDPRTFDFRDAEDDGEITLTLDSDSPLSGILEVKPNSNVSNKTVMITRAEADDGDITLKDMYVKVDSTESVVDNVVRNLTLMEGTTRIAQESVMKNTGSAITGKDEDGNSYTIIDTNEYYVHFEDLEDVVIDEGDEVTLTITAEFYKQSQRYENGTQVTFTVRALEGENSNGSDIVNGNIMTGSARTFSLYSEGLTFSNVRESVKTQKEGSVGIFTLTFDVEAFGDDMYVPMSIARQTGTSTVGSVGAEYSIANGNGGRYTLGNTSDSLRIEDAKEANGYFRLAKGTTYQATILVSLDNVGAVTDFYQVRLEAFRFADSPTGTEHTIVTGFNSFKTDTEWLAN